MFNKAPNGGVQVAARAAFNLHFIFDDGMAPNRGSPATICYPAPDCNALLFSIVNKDA
jgi:hypothetical protein